jgi:hypothetical protein
MIMVATIISSNVNPRACFMAGSTEAKLAADVRRWNEIWSYLRSSAFIRG